MGGVWVGRGVGSDVEERIIIPPFPHVAPGESCISRGHIFKHCCPCHGMPTLALCVSLSTHSLGDKSHEALNPN